MNFALRPSVSGASLGTPEDFRDPDSLPASVAITLDWNAYFKHFTELHGEPVIWKNRLLFADGWTYNLRSKEGPEWPPPADDRELHQMQMSYWLKRLSLVQTEWNVLSDIIHGLRELQRRHHLPLQHRLVSYDEEQGRYITQTQTVDIHELENGRLAWLAQDIEDCQAKLRELNSLLKRE